MRKFIEQFYPESIFQHGVDECDLKMKTQYSSLKRNEKEFFEHITNLIDLLEENKLPPLNPNCNDCLFILNQKDLINENK